MTNGRPEPVEQFDVGGAMSGVRLVESSVVEVEAVGVLHNELARPNQPGPRSSFVPIFCLDLVKVDGQIPIGTCDVFHHQGEHLFVGGCKKEVCSLTVLKAEQVVAVLGPPSGSVVRLAGKQRREMDLLEAGLVHLIADHLLDVTKDLPPQREP